MDNNNSGTNVPANNNSNQNTSDNAQDNIYTIQQQQQVWGVNQTNQPQIKKQFSLDANFGQRHSADAQKVRALFHKNKSKSTDDHPSSQGGSISDDLCDCDSCLLGFDDTQPDGIAKKRRLKQTAVHI